MRALRKGLTRDESGLSMAELLIYVLLLSGVLIMIGSLFINSLRTEDTVSSVVDATTSGQLASSSLTTAVRNSSGMTLTTVNGTDQLLLARVSNATGVYSCYAWYYSNSDNSIRTMRQLAKITSDKWTDPTKLKLWTLLAENVVPADGVPASGALFSLSGADNKILNIDYRVLADDNPPATISTSAVRRLTETSTQCWP